MQLNLILRIAWHSELCVQRLHVLPQFARYAATNQANILDHFVVVEEDAFSEKYTSFKMRHNRKLDAYGNTMHAVLYTGVKTWYCNGEAHRTDCDANGNVLPAFIYPNKNKEWWYHNKLHRNDRDEFGRVLPARIKADGSKEWRCHGKLHCNDRDELGRVLPARIEADGSKEWRWHGKLHRADCDEHGKLLPAVIMQDHVEYWIHGKKIE